MIVEYIWLDAKRQFRSKTRILPNWDGTLENLPIWNFDGSSTGQAPGVDSEVYIRPIMMTHDPFRGGGPNVLALCDNWVPSENELLAKPHETNSRHIASKTFFNNKVLAEDPWFGFELEFFFKKNGKLLGLETQDIIKTRKQGDFYCGVGASNIFGREVAEDTLQNVLNSFSYNDDEIEMGFSNIQITGLNFEVAPGQCEFQIFGKGIHAADSYYMFKYILERTAEKHGIDIEYNPKPVTNGDWNGSGCHTNYSIESMRKKDSSSYQVILDSIEKLKKKHDLHIQNYGEGNKKRLTGKHETASWKNFSHGVADRGSSIRIPRQTFQQKYGYIEDRRPASTCDPYIVSSLIADTTIL